jgi:hypothetical protein
MLTRSRPQHKNDNCFVEQKNGAVVKNYVGYARFDTDTELSAMVKVYKSLALFLISFVRGKSFSVKLLLALRQEKSMTGLKLLFKG